MRLRNALLVGLTVAIATATANAAPAVWAPHELIVDLHDLPKHYSCNDLWYRFKGILLTLGARQDMQILPYGCEGNSPAVQLNFATPRLVTGVDAHWSELNVVARTVQLEPGSPSVLDNTDCELLRQVKGSLLKFLENQIVTSQLSCDGSAKTTFSVTVKALLPEASTAPSAPPASAPKAHS